MNAYLARFTGLAVICCLFGGIIISWAETVPVADPGPTLEKLKAGNAQFVADPESSAKPTRRRRLETARAQRPMAIIVGCSDSRIPPEMIFNQNIGDLFVVRAAGELVDDYALGSIEYAVAHLGARLIVVLGHERCGAVAAAVASADAPGHVGEIVRSIRPAVEQVRGESGDVLTNAIKKNVDRVSAKIREKSELGALASEIRVVEAYYDLNTGKVEWLSR